MQLFLVGIEPTAYWSQVHHLTATPRVLAVIVTIVFWHLKQFDWLITEWHCYVTLLCDMWSDHVGHCHVTYAVVDNSSDGTYSLRCLKQKQFVDGVGYLLQEIYGIENKNTERAKVPHCNLSTNHLSDEFRNTCMRNALVVICCDLHTRTHSLSVSYTHLTLPTNREV